MAALSARAELMRQKLLAQLAAGQRARMIGAAFGAWQRCSADAKRTTCFSEHLGHVHQRNAHVINGLLAAWDDSQDVAMLRSVVRSWAAALLGQKLERLSHISEARTRHLLSKIRLRPGACGGSVEAAWLG